MLLVAGLPEMFGRLWGRDSCGQGDSVFLLPFLPGKSRSVTMGVCMRRAVDFPVWENFAKRLQRMSFEAGCVKEQYVRMALSYQKNAVAEMRTTSKRLGFLEIRQESGLKREYISD